jgi:hypothetical protein
MHRNPPWRVRPLAGSDCYGPVSVELIFAIPELCGIVRSRLPTAACGCRRGNPGSVVQYW